MDVVLTDRHTEPSGDTSFDEGKEEDQTEYDGVTSSDVGFLFVSLIMYAEKGARAAERRALNALGSLEPEDGDNGRPSIFDLVGSHPSPPPFRQTTQLGQR